MKSQTVLSGAILAAMSNGTFDAWEDKPSVGDTCVAEQEFGINRFASLKAPATSSLLSYPRFSLRGLRLACSLLHLWW